MALKLNLIPKHLRPLSVIREGRWDRAKQCVCASKTRPFVWFAALLVFIARLVVFGVVGILAAIVVIPLGVVVGVLLTPLWLWFAFRWLRDLYQDGGAPFFRWCIVVECAPEEVAALAQTLRDQVEPQERQPWLLLGAHVTPVGVYLPRHLAVSECYPAQPDVVFCGGRLTMQWLAEKLRAARIPCSVAWRYRSLCKTALQVQPETLQEDWPSLIARWTRAN